jgi:light-regulated signal transduction histidine kinase (bacteriophytochrome)
MESKPVTPQAEIDRQAVIEAEALLAALTEFSQRAGHDLLGPLSQAGSLLALFLKRHKDQTGADGNELLEFLQSASARMEGLVVGVRKYMEVAGRRSHPEPVDLNASLAGARVSLAAPISGSAAAILADTLPVVMANPVQMTAMFEILIGNAIKFRRPEAAPDIRISARPEGEWTAIAVEDNGIGIEPESCDAVFLPFKRLNGREYPGQGLGLATAKLIAAMYGDGIRVDRSAAGGTRVEFRIRAA